jgi:hypothetical protein
MLHPEPLDIKQSHHKTLEIADLTIPITFDLLLNEPIQIQPNIWKTHHVIFHLVKLAASTFKRFSHHIDNYSLNEVRDRSHTLVPHLSRRRLWSAEASS